MACRLRPPTSPRHIYHPRLLPSWTLYPNNPISHRPRHSRSTANNTLSRIQSLLPGSDFIAAIPHLLGNNARTAPKLKSILKTPTTDMPSFRAQNMPTVIHAQPSSPKKGGVVFPKDPVASVSRPVNTAESWAAYDFEMHAMKCAYCHDPYEVHRSRNQLCDVGHRLAQEIAKYIYNKADGATYSTIEEGSKPIRVEVPASYIEVAGLLRAIERSLRHRSRRPFVSMDRSYYVAPRTPASSSRSRSVKVEQDSRTRTSRPRSGEIVDWPEKPQSQSKHRVLAEISNSTSAKRGSLYEEDLVKQRRNTQRYSVEVREPTQHDLRQHRLSGYYR